MNNAATGRTRTRTRGPTVSQRIIAPHVVQEVEAIVHPSPDYHLGAGPHRRVPVASSGGVDAADRSPTVGRGIVAAPVVQEVVATVPPSPDYHLGASPHRRVVGATDGRASAGARGPTVGRWIVATEITAAATPDNHLAAGPHRRVVGATSGRADAADRSPTVGRRIVAAPVIKTATKVVTSPDDHFAASPHRRVPVARGGRRSVRPLFPNIPKIHFAYLDITRVDEIPVVVVAGKDHTTAGHATLAAGDQVGRRRARGQIGARDRPHADVRCREGARDLAGSDAARDCGCRGRHAGVGRVKRIWCGCQRLAWCKYDELAAAVRAHADFEPTGLAIEHAGPKVEIHREQPVGHTHRAVGDRPAEGAAAAAVAVEDEFQVVAAIGRIAAIRKLAVVGEGRAQRASRADSRAKRQRDD